MSFPSYTGASLSGGESHDYDDGTGRYGDYEIIISWGSLNVIGIACVLSSMNYWDYGLNFFKHHRNVGLYP